MLQCALLGTEVTKNWCDSNQKNRGKHAENDAVYC